MDRRRIRQAWKTLTSPFRATGRFLLDHWRTILVCVALLAGWGLLTWGIAELTTKWAWPISGGLLLLGLVGFDFLKHIFTIGLYTLSQD